MGNEASSPALQNNGEETPPNESERDDVADALYATMKRFFVESTKGMNDAEKDVVLNKIHSKLLSEYRRTQSDADGDELCPTLSIQEHLDEKDICKSPLLNLSNELIAHVFSYCSNRTDQNYLSLANKRIHEIYQDPRLVTSKCWPTKRFFEMPPDPEHWRGEAHRASQVFFSSDVSFAVIYAAGYCAINDDEFSEMRVYDRSRGLLESRPCERLSKVKPAFSPDSRLLIMEIDDWVYDGLDGPIGLRICHLPTRENNYQMVASDCLLGKNRTTGEDLEVYAISFIDNTTILCSTNDAYDGHVGYLKMYKIVPSDNSDGSQSPMMLKEIPSAIETSVRIDQSGRFVSWSGNDRTIICVLTGGSTSTFTFYESRRWNSITKTIPVNTRNVMDMSFSLDGTMLVVACGANLFVFDFELVDVIDSLCDSTSMSVSPPFEKKGSVSFLPSRNGRHIMTVADYESGYDINFRVIDLDTRAVVSEGWKDETWKYLLQLGRLDSVV